MSIEIDHDLGFLFTLHCVAAYKLTGDEAAKQLALEAAEMLKDRFIEKGQFILAWGDPNDTFGRRNNRCIVDCMMNLPLLYWATEVTGNPVIVKSP